MAGSPLPPAARGRTNLGILIAIFIVFGLLIFATVELFIHQQYFDGAALVLLTFVILVFLGYAYPAFSWTGFGPYRGPEDRDHQPRMLWDWLTLLIIPIVLAAGALGFGAFQSQENFNLSQAQFQLAATQYVNDKQLAQVQQVEANLQSYLDSMAGLLLNPDLHRDNQQGVNVRILATARTLTILPDLDGPRKAILLKFLHASGLISRQNPNPKFIHYIDPIVNLNGADFSGVDLTGFVLGGADLAFVNFSGATLNAADLSSTNLNGAILSGAHLRNANLCFAQVTPQAHLNKADLSSAFLGGTDLTGADMSSAILEGANLGVNDPTCHALQHPNEKLPGATLTNANLHGANLSSADLTGAIVINVDFKNAIWSATTCPDGSSSNAHQPSSCNVG